MRLQPVASSAIAPGIKGWMRMGHLLWWWLILRVRRAPRITHVGEDSYAPLTQHVGERRVPALAREFVETRCAGVDLVEPVAVFRGGAGPRGLQHAARVDHHHAGRAGERIGERSIQLVDDGV